MASQTADGVKAEDLLLPLSLAKAEISPSSAKMDSDPSLHDGRDQPRMKQKKTAVVKRDTEDDDKDEDEKPRKRKHTVSSSTLEATASIRSKLTYDKAFAQQRAPAKNWSQEEMKALLDIELEVALDNIARFVESPALADRNSSKINNKLRQRYASQLKALQAPSVKAEPKSEPKAE